jgi:hypothetical protein
MVIRAGALATPGRSVDSVVVAQMRAPAVWASLLVAMMSTACASAGKPERPPTSAASGRSDARGGTSARDHAAAAGEHEGKAFETKLVVLYQPDRVLRVRVRDVPAFAAYMKNVESTCNAFFAKASKPHPLDVVVAIKPEGNARVWFIGAPPQDGHDGLSALKRKLESLAPPAIQSGPVAFAIIGAIAGAERRDVDPQKYEPPLPKEWVEALEQINQRAAIPDDVLLIVWP